MFSNEMSHAIYNLYFKKDVNYVASVCKKVYFKGFSWKEYK